MASNTSPLFVLADLQFQSCAALYEFIARVVEPNVHESVDESNLLNATCRAYLYRVATWLRTLSKLNQPSDLQAIDAAARSLFEVDIDLTLLRYDIATTPIEMMLDWEASARFKRDELRLTVLSDMTDEHSKKLAAVAKSRVEANTGYIHALREKWWPTGKKNPSHPNRWTGRNLFDDADRADQVSGASAHARHHRLRHAELCWNTHGSAFAGVRGLDEQAIFAGVAQSLWDCYKMAREATEHILVVLERYDEAMVAEFDNFDKQVRDVGERVLQRVVPSST
jgi:hypothetical protein